MKSLSLLNLEINEAFMKPELRVRVRKGILKDQIHFGIFSRTLEEHLTAKEIKLALKEKLIHKEYISKESETRVVYVYLNRQCRQVSGFKKLIEKIKSTLWF